MSVMNSYGISTELYSSIVGKRVENVASIRNITKFEVQAMQPPTGLGLRWQQHNIVLEFPCQDLASLKFLSIES